MPAEDFQDPSDEWFSREFVAKFTSRNDVGDPPVYWYFFIEQQFDASTGQYVGRQPRREGYAREVANLAWDVSGEPIATVRVKGVVNGRVAYEFTRPNDSPAPTYVLVTGPVDAGYYPCVTTSWDAEAEEWVDSEDEAWAFGANEEDLEEGVRYLALLTGPDSEGVPVYVASAPAGAGGGIDVLDSVTLTGYPDATELYVVQDNGLYLGAGPTVGMGAASAADEGAVTTATQEFAGRKVFTDGLQVTENAGASSTAGWRVYAFDASTNVGSIVWNNGGGIAANAETVGGVSGFAVEVYGVGTSRVTAWSGTPGDQLILIGAGNKFAVRNGTGGAHVGQSGTVAGATVTGGIITALGSGVSFGSLTGTPDTVSELGFASFSGNAGKAPVVNGTETSWDFAAVAAAVSPPANSSSAGTAGQYAYDGSYFYICTGTNTWRRVAVSSF